jgi:hypothetical protein
MKPEKIGQVARFHTPLPDENPDQLYVVLEIIDDVEKPRADIKALNTGLSFPPLLTVLLDDLEIVELATSDLVGHEVIIKKDEYLKETGIVVKVSEHKVVPDLTKGDKGVETNICLTIIDESGKEHTGTLFVN